MPNNQAMVYEEAANWRAIVFRVLEAVVGKNSVHPFF
jgi:hypothetical protein